MIGEGKFNSNQKIPYPKQNYFEQNSYLQFDKVPYELLNRLEKIIGIKITKSSQLF